MILDNKNRHLQNIVNNQNMLILTILIRVRLGFFQTIFAYSIPQSLGVYPQ